MNNLDILAIGDITVDAFIKIKDAHLNCNINNEDCELCFRFGEKIPFESVTEVFSAGNGPNAAICASKLGLNVSLVAGIGGDENGKKCLETLKSFGVETRYISKYSEINTNYHYVLWYGTERTILVHHKEYQRIFPAILEKPKWIYLSSLGTNSYEYQDKIIEYLENNPDIHLFFQPGTFQIASPMEKIASIYKRSEILAVNLSEAKKILKLSKDATNTELSIEKILRDLSSLGPKTVLVTDGQNGSHMLYEEKIISTPAFEFSKPTIERTGSGDAFASTFLGATILGKSPEEAIKYATINASSVSTEIGPQRGLLTIAEIEKYL